MTNTDTKRSYEEIQAAIKALEAEANEILRSEKAQALSQARALVQKYSLTARELGIDASGAPLIEVPKATRKAVEPKYAQPSNPELTWSGRGRTPKWVEAALASGLTLEELIIKK